MKKFLLMSLCFCGIGYGGDNSSLSSNALWTVEAYDDKEYRTKIFEETVGFVGAELGGSRYLINTIVGCMESTSLIARGDELWTEIRECVRQSVQSKKASDRSSWWKELYDINFRICCRIVNYYRNHTDYDPNVMFSIIEDVTRGWKICAGDIARDIGIEKELNAYSKKIERVKEDLCGAIEEVSADVNAWKQVRAKIATLQEEQDLSNVSRSITEKLSGEEDGSGKNRTETSKSGKNDSEEESESMSMSENLVGEIRYVGYDENVVTCVIYTSISENLELQIVGAASKVIELCEGLYNIGSPTLVEEYDKVKQRFAKYNTDVVGHITRILGGFEVCETTGRHTQYKRVFDNIIGGYKGGDTITNLIGWQFGVNTSNKLEGVKEDSDKKIQESAARRIYWMLYDMMGIESKRLQMTKGFASGMIYGAYVNSKKYKKYIDYVKRQYQRGLPILEMKKCRSMFNKSKYEVALQYLGVIGWDGKIRSDRNNMQQNGESEKLLIANMERVVYALQEVISVIPVFYENNIELERLRIGLEVLLMIQDKKCAAQIPVQMIAKHIKEKKMADVGIANRQVLSGIEESAKKLQTICEGVHMEYDIFDVAEECGTSVIKNLGTLFNCYITGKKFNERYVRIDEFFKLEIVSLRELAVYVKNFLENLKVISSWDEHDEEKVGSTDIKDIKSEEEVENEMLSQTEEEPDVKLINTENVENIDEISRQPNDKDVETKNKMENESDYKNDNDTQVIAKEEIVECVKKMQKGFEKIIAMLEGVRDNEA